MNVFLQWRIHDFSDGRRQPRRWGRQSIIWSIFSQNCMKMKETESRGEHASLAPANNLRNEQITFFQ